MVIFTLWTLVITVLFVRTILKPGSQTVFPIFHTAGGRWLNSKNLYQGGTEYRYSPLIAAFFVPFSLLPMWLANLVWRGLNVALYLGAVGTWLRRGTSRIPAGNQAFVFLLMLPLSIGSLNNAQSNPLLIAVIMSALIAARNERWTSAALCIGFVTYLKVYPLAAGLLLTLLFPKKFAWRLAAALLALGALSFILQRPAYVLEQYRSWVATRSVDERHYSVITAPRDLWMLLRVFGIELNLRFYFVVQILGGAAIAALCLFGRLRGWATDRLLTTVFTLVCGWMLLLGPATESATYILLAPAICLAAVEAFSRPFPGWMRSLLAAALVILIGGAAFIAWAGRRRDIWSMSIQPFGTVLFCVFAVAWVFRDSLWSDSHPGDADVRTSS